jgi:hypothetical protein
MPASTEVRIHRTSGAGPRECGERGWSYAAGFDDGRDQALDGKPPLCAASQYGNGFYDGWRSVRYSVDTEIVRG